MPANVVTAPSTSAKTGKSKKELERLWRKAKGIVQDQYPKIKPDSDRFYQYVMGIWKRMAKLESAAIQGWKSFFLGS